MLRREILLDHYQNPINKGYDSEEGYIKVNTNSENAARIASNVRRGTQPAGRRIIKRRAY